ncbi:hypothetical protein [Sphingopyxis sp. LC81]|uniref:hypothetical protein n=1 Tax=Sphingopyxis sp. LC81 TaxID=1502850 RepID=UPI00055C38D8|nr:hypothetical protein [Sphingopyxis sp. LC81]
MNEASSDVIQPASSGILCLTAEQEGAILVGQLDCPSRNNNALARWGHRLRSLLHRRPSWIHRGLANSKLEALRIWICLQNYPDAALEDIVRRELKTEFSPEQLEQLAANARQLRYGAPAINEPPQISRLL